MRRSLLLAATFTVIPAALAAQQTLLRLAPPAGQVSQYRIESSTAVDMMQASMDATSILVMTATVTGAEGEEYTVETVVDSFRIDAPGVPMPPMPDMVGSTTTVRMTTRGRVLETTYSNEELTQAFGGMAGPQGSSFQAGMTLPEHPVAPGYTWNDSSSVETDAGPAGLATVTTLSQYTFEGVQRRNGARIAVIRITGTITQSSAMATMEGTMEGATEFDLDAGRWVTNRMAVSMQMSAQGQDMAMTIRMDGRLKG